MGMKNIVTDPTILAGKPVIRGTRIPVYLILNLLAQGYTFERVIKAYPQLKRDDITAALEYAHNMAKREEIFDLPRMAA